MPTIFGNHVCIDLRVICDVFDTFQSVAPGLFGENFLRRSTLPHKTPPERISESLTSG